MALVLPCTAVLPLPAVIDTNVLCYLPLGQAWWLYHCPGTLLVTVRHVIPGRKALTLAQGARALS